MRLSKTNIAIAILIIFHAVGIGGVLLVGGPEFLELTPLNLLLTAGLILFAHVDWRNFWVLPATIVLSYFVEVIGVNTGIPFGNYSYGEVLGFKALNTPMIIGINWMILLYGSLSIVRRLISVSQVNTALIAAALMVILDYLIEPVAIRFNFWSWENIHPPIENYLAWFGIAFLFGWLWEWSKIKLNTTVGIAVYAVELLFFGILNLLPQ